MSAAAAAVADPGKHPRGLYVLFGVTAWERFGYYGMRAILTLYMVNYLFQSLPKEEATAKAGTIYGWFTGLVYLTPVIGGYLADRYLGKKLAIVLGAALMGLGYLLMAVPNLIAFYVALGIVIVGNGFFKPTTSTAVGHLYVGREGLKDAAFTIFYMGINLGALVSPILCGLLAEKIGWSWGFVAAGSGMIVAIAMFFAGLKHLGPALASPQTASQLPAGAPGAAGPRAPDAPLTVQEKQEVAVIFILAFFVIFFWSVFEQAGSSLTIFADRSTDRTLCTLDWAVCQFEVPASWFQSLNPIFIVLLGVPFARLWGWLARRGRNPSTPAKMALGLLLVSLGFLIMLPASWLVADGNKVSMLWLAGVYLTHTFGELCLSPVGLSMVSKLAPAKLASMMMGIWFTSNFVANLVGGLFAGMYDKLPQTTFFLIPACSAGVAALVLAFLSRPVSRWMHGKA
ncbi:MAG: peptide MFS transporter [Myxococcota bacterium]|jgi:POT family proton-dependent oligopeptide transporter|nr:peptide MFS transporter [Myxococcota bacterium]